MNLIFSVIFLTLILNLNTLPCPYLCYHPQTLRAAVISIIIRRRKDKKSRLIGLKSERTKVNFLTIHVHFSLTGNNAFKSPEDFKVSLPLRTNYLYGRIKKSLPEMYAFTVCMWLKSSASPGIGTPFSYGVPGQANEIVLIEWGNNPIELLVNDKVGP